MRSGFLKPVDSERADPPGRMAPSTRPSMLTVVGSTGSRHRSTGHVYFKHRVLRHWGPGLRGQPELPEQPGLPEHPERCHCKRELQPRRSKPERHRRNHCNDACRTNRGSACGRGTWPDHGTWRDHGSGACDRGNHHNPLRRHHKPGHRHNHSRHNHGDGTGRPKPSSRCRSTTGRRSRKTARSRILTCDSSRILLQVYRNVRVRKTKLAGYCRPTCSAPTVTARG